MARNARTAPGIDPLLDPKEAAIMGYKFKTQELTALSVANMRDVLFGTNSTNSPDVLLRGSLKRPPHEFWPLFHEFWPTCDNTWRWGERFLRLLQRNGDARPYMEQDQTEFLGRLPDEIQVFRGCSRSRVNAISWTTDREVAEDFAAGHRSIRVPEAVVASALVPKELIITVILARQEKEVLLDPMHLQNVKVSHWVRA